MKSIDLKQRQLKIQKMHNLSIEMNNELNLNDKIKLTKMTKPSSYTTKN
jgi:hypothetical protein